MFNTSATGAVRALMPIGYSRRSWDVSIPYIQPDDYAPLMELLRTPWLNAPYVWVSPEASATNLLSPQTAALSAFASRKVGRVPLTEGGFAASAISADPAGYTTISDAPTLPGKPVTATARCMQGDALAPVRVVLREYGLDDTLVQETWSANVAGNVGDTAALSPVTVTVSSAHAAGVRCTLSIYAAAAFTRPQVTWTDHAVLWGPGEGCPQVAIVPGDRTVRAASKTDWYFVRADVAFTVRELG